MGFAAGMRAGQLAVEGAIDQYNQVKRARQMREVEEQIKAAQQANAERQYGIGTQDATTGMTGAQQQQAVMPQAPSATGLSPEQQAAMVGMGTAQQLPPVGLSNEQRANLGLPPSAAAPDVITSATGLSTDQLAGAMQEPRRPTGEYVPMSESSVERLRADKLRGLGYTDEADKALGRAVQMEQIEYQKQQDASAEARDERRLAMSEKESDLRRQLTELNIDTAKLEYDELKAINNAYQAYQNFEGDLGEYMQTPEWKKLGIRGQQELVKGATGLATNLQNLSTMNIQNELSKATDLTSMVSAANRLSATDGIDVRATVDEETGAVTLTSFYNDVAADNYQQERGKPIKFSSEAEAMRYIAEMAKDPILAADNFIKRRQQASALAREAAQQGIDNTAKFVETRASIIEALLGDTQTYAKLDEADKLAFDEQVAIIMAPLVQSLGVSGEQMGGLPNASSSMTSGGSSSPQDVGLTSAPDKRYGATFDDIVGVPARAVGDAASAVGDAAMGLVDQAQANSIVLGAIKKGAPLTDIPTNVLTTALNSADGRYAQAINAELARRQ